MGDLQLQYIRLLVTTCETAEIRQLITVVHQTKQSHRATIEDNDTFLFATPVQLK